MKVALAQINTTVGDLAGNEFATSSRDRDFADQSEWIVTMRRFCARWTPPSSPDRADARNGQ